MPDFSAENYRENDLNYENCIVTRHEDSSDDQSSVFSLPEYTPYEISQSEVPDVTLDDADPLSCITVEHVAHAELSKPDTLIFTLSLLNRIEQYLSNLKEDEHKKWLKDKNGIIKSVLIKNCTSFDIDEVQSIGGTIYIKQSHNEKDSNMIEKSSALKNKTPDEKKKTPKQRVPKKTSKNLQISGVVNSEIDMSGHSEPEPSVNDCSGHSDPVPSVSECSGRRRSKRLEEFQRDRELVYIDKLAYIEYKMSPAKFWQRIEEEKQQSIDEKNQLEEVRRSRKAKRSLGANSGSKAGKAVATPRAKRTETEKPDEKMSAKPEKSTANKSTKKPYTRKGRSFRVEDIMQFSRTRAQKRRAVSLNRISKKAKDSQLSSSSAASSLNATRSKRVLFSPAEWLETFKTMSSLAEN